MASFSRIVLLLSFFTRMQCRTGFLINPSDVHSIIGTTAQFRCRYARHSNESAYFSWSFNFDNAEATHIDPLVTTTHGSIDINSSLTVEVTDIGYNGTEVYCLIIITETARTEVSEVAKLYVMDVPDIEKPTLMVFTNGTLLISWDALSMGNTLAVLQDNELSYDLLILSGSGEECERLEDLSYDRTSYDLIPANLTCNAQGLDDCESISVYLTPIINDEFSGRRAKVSTALQPFSLTQSEDAVMITNDSFQFSYRINTTVPLSFCTVEVNLTNVFNGQQYSVNATTMGACPTNDVRVRIEKDLVPFDNHYTAVVSLGNGYQNEQQTAENIITLSMYAIQNVSQRDGYVVIHFARGTNAQGAFIICNNTESTEFNYSMVNRNDAHDTAELETVLEGSQCSILVYDVSNDGLLKDSKELRPSYVLQNQPCIMRATTNSALDRRGISSNARVEEDYIVFECNVTDPDANGCIAIVHDIQDYSTLLVNNIPRETPSINRTVERGKNYSYVIFEWAQSGLLTSQMLDSGSLTVPPMHTDSLTTESDSTHPIGTESETTAIITATVIIIIVIVGVIIVTITTLTVVIFYAKQNLSETPMLSETQSCRIEHEEHLPISLMTLSNCEPEEESLLKDDTSESEMETIDNMIPEPTHRVFYDAPGKPKLNGNNFNDVSATNDRDQLGETENDSATLRDRIQKEL